MLDNEIVDLYWARSEDAIVETDQKYGAYCYRIADNILKNNEDSMECLNDTYLKAWNSMPEERPNKLAAFLGRITRNLALTRYRYQTAKKRSTGFVEIALDELRTEGLDIECPDEAISKMVFDDVINCFLSSLSKTNRDIFVNRYWFFESVKEIASKSGITENGISIRLNRMKKDLKAFLEKEGGYK